MPIIKKKDFNRTKFVHEATHIAIDELVDPDGTFIDSSIPNAEEDEIMTGPIETPAKERGTTTYEKGISPTTDKVRTNTSQGSSWQRAYGIFGTGPYGQASRIGGWTGWLRENDINEDMVSDKVEREDILDKIKDNELAKNTEFMDLINKIDKLDNKQKKAIHKLLSDAKS
jgi:hypothetical protein